MPAAGSELRRTPVVEAVEKALPAVVNIGTERIVRVDYRDPRRRLRGNLFDELLYDFLGPPAPPGYAVTPSLGSGIIIHPDGYILTNFHVVERASVIQITLADESRYVARIVAADEISDLALLKIEPIIPLQAIELADNDDLYLGETVIVLGNPFGLAHTVTVGVLSAKDREARHKGEVLYRDILQTDAAVNPGTSGGPLLNVEGKLIGVNVAIYKEAQNIGFAVPVKRARALLGRWFEPRLINKLWLGLATREEDGSVLIDSVVAGGPAAGEGLKAGEPIRTVNGEPVSSLYAFNKALLYVREGEVVELGVEREGRVEIVPVDMVAMPKPSGDQLALEHLGLRFGLPGSTLVAGRFTFDKGLPIVEVFADGPAAAVGLRPGLLITRIDDYEIHSPDDVGVALERVAKGDMVSMTVVSVTEADSFIVAQSTTVSCRAD
jgi:S1-C subfamily serine protease